jgi:hypothetical protein
MSLIGFVVLVALAIGAAINPTVLSASLAFTFALALIATALVGTLSCRDRDRPVWAAVAIFSSLYLLIAFGPGSETNGVTVPPFPTMGLYELVRDSSLPSPVGDVGITDRPPAGEQMTERTKVVSLASRPGPVTGSQIRPTQGANQIVLSVVPATNLLQLRRILHCLGSIAFGLLGAWIARVVFVRAEPDRSRSTPDPSFHS